MFLIKNRRITINNVFVNWPKSALWKIYESIIRKSFLRNIIFFNSPVVLTDKFGMRFVFYSWIHEPLEKLITKRHLVGEFEAISRIVRQGNVVIDIGANVGTHSYIMSKIIGNEGVQYSFEPVPETYKILMENVALNRISNTICINSALSDNDGSVDMNIFPMDFSEWNSFGTPDTNESKPISKINVNTIKLDTFIRNNNIKYVDFIKIDAEGAEKNIFDGSVNVFNTNRVGVISFEISKIPLAGNGSNSNDIFDFLKKIEFNVYEFDNKEKKFKGPIYESNKDYAQYYASKSLDLSKM